MSAKDARQLRKMQSQIALYRAQSLPLKGLVNDLEFLLSHIEGTDASWRQSVLSQVGVLEDTYAVALDKKGGVLASADLWRVNSALASLDDLIKSQLENYDTED